MAATYPLEVVQADRWLKANPKKTGAELDAALKTQSWDPAVKSLCTFPTLLQLMSENLDWTQDLGDAFLGQRADLMQAVQRLRKKAQDAGQLKTTKEQKVVVQEETIIIQSTSPEVIYVPTYPPSVVYVPAYPYYPAMYPPPPPPGAKAVTFAAGVAVGAAIWGDCDWDGHDVNIDIDRSATFNRNTNVNVDRSARVAANASGQATWSHDPNHRKGVNYKSPQAAQQYGAAKGGGGVTTQTAARAGGQPTGGTKPSTAKAAPKASGTSGSSAFAGSQNASLDRAASARGSSSRASGGARGGGRLR
jgi:hypothetical protein